MRDCDSFVIGGLTQESSITTRSKIPLLEDIPLFGQAFRTDRGTRSKIELYLRARALSLNIGQTKARRANRGRAC